MQRKIIVYIFISLLCTLSYISFSQTITTINYQADSYSCNVFPIARYYAGFIHQTSYGAPSFYGTRGVALLNSGSPDHSYISITQYGIAFNFKNGYNYKIRVYGASVGALGEVNLPSSVGILLSNTFVGGNANCGDAVFSTSFRSPYHEAELPDIDHPGWVTLMDQVINQDANYLLVAGFPLLGNTGAPSKAIVVTIEITETPPSYAILGAELFCSGSSSYSLSTTSQCNTTVQWSVSPLGVVSISPLTGPQTTLTKLNDGVVTLTANINACGHALSPVTKEITVGTTDVNPSGTYTHNANYSPQYLYMNPSYYGIVFYYNHMCTQATTNLNVPHNTNVTWTLKSVTPPNYVYWYQSGYNLIETLASNQTAVFEVTYTNTCGSGIPFLVGFTAGYCTGGGYYYYAVTPNPATSTVKIKADVTKAKQKDAHSNITGVTIYDQQGNLKKHQKFGKVTEATIDISGLNTGIYIIEIEDGNYKERQQLSIQK